MTPKYQKRTAGFNKNVFSIIKEHQWMPTLPRSQDKPRLLALLTDEPWDGAGRMLESLNGKYIISRRG
jgi:hypothetical protein